jgi:membrane protein
VRVLVDAAKIWVERDPFRDAGALAFYTLFSLAPLIIILVAIVGVVYGQDAARGEIAAALSNLLGDKAALAVQDAVQRSRPDQAGVIPTLVGFGALLFGATTVFAQMQGSLNRFWDVQAKPTRSGVLKFITVRLLSLGMVLIVGFLLLISFAVSVALSGVLQYAGHWIPVPTGVSLAIDIALSLAVTTLLFAMLFKVLPDVNLEWIDVRRGAFFTAVMFVLGQYLISMYLTRVAPNSTFGAAGSLVLVLFWVYYSSLILFFGAALTRALVDHGERTLVPKKTAVRVKTVIQEE